MASLEGQRGDPWRGAKGRALMSQGERAERGAVLGVEGPLLLLPRESLNLQVSAQFSAKWA